LRLQEKVFNQINSNNLPLLQKILIKRTKIAWAAYQYYKEGSVVEWTKDEGTDTPHSITDIVAGTSTDDHHDDQVKTDETKKDDVKTADVKTTDTNKSDSLPS
jgi:hypothetical protein